MGTTYDEILAKCREESEQYRADYEAKQAVPAVEAEVVGVDLSPDTGSFVLHYVPPGLSFAESIEPPVETPCQEAQRITTPGGARHENYGHPLDDYTRTAAIWTALLAHKLKPGEAISPQDAIRCMIAVKLSRDVHKPKRDNRVDIAGYANCLQFADEEAERRAKANAA